MKEIRIHGRGGQGAVTAAELIAIAVFENGWFVQAFPSFGVERRGAPVTAFVRLDDVPIRLRSQIYNPDFVIVLDETLIEVVDVASGIKQDGFILINSAKNSKDFNLNAKVITIDATCIALNIIGKPIVNTTILGAFAGVCRELDLNPWSLGKAYLAKETSSDSIIDAIKERFPNHLLFGWEEIPGNDSNRFIEFLRQSFGINWVRTAKIDKIEDGRTINVISENNSLLLRLNNKKTKAFLRIDDGRTDEFIVKMENGKLNIYVPEEIAIKNIEAMQIAFNKMIA